MSAAALAYAENVVRTQAHSLIWPAFFLSPRPRLAYFALTALNAELASVDDTVKNPALRDIRFKWWQDGIKQALTEPASPEVAAHPILSLLAFFAGTITPYHLSRLVSTRSTFSRATPGTPFKTLDDLGTYALGTQGSILYALMQVADTSNSNAHAQLFVHSGAEHSGQAPQRVHGKARAADPVTVDHAASHLAVFLTVALLLRSVPFHATKRTSIFPVALAAEHGLAEETLFRHGPTAPGLQETTAALLSIALKERDTVTEVLEGYRLEKDARALFSASVAAERYLDALQATSKANFDPFAATLQKRDWMLPGAVWWRVRQNR